jgi:hypothetical protein
MLEGSKGHTPFRVVWHHATRGEAWLRMWLMDGTTRPSETWIVTVPDTGYRIIS